METEAKKNDFILLTDDLKVKEAYWAMKYNKDSDKYCQNDWENTTSPGKILY